MPETVPYAIVEIDKRGTAKVSVFVGQNEVIRLTGIRKVYIDYDEQKSRGLWLIPVASFRNFDDTVFIVTPARLLSDALVAATVNALEHIAYRLPEVLKALIPEVAKIAKE
ncbi:MAG: hypothetical protein LM580_07875 [Thermofilum sp.]|nr:hypothetical protein [Thermofilum sp.]